MVRIPLPLFHPPLPSLAPCLRGQKGAFGEVVVSRALCVLRDFPTSPFADSANLLAHVKCLEPGAVPVSSALPPTLGGSLGFHSRTLGPEHFHWHLEPGAILPRGAVSTPALLTPGCPHEIGGSLEGGAVSPLSDPSTFRGLA